MFDLNWSYAYGKPLSTAVFKAKAEDFIVNECFDRPFSGVGEHVLLKIEKKNLNTEDVVKDLSRQLKKSTKFISYAGLKDRQSFSTQWFSVHAPGEPIHVEGLSGAHWKVIESTRHSKKLKPGFLSENEFIIRLREVSDLLDLQNRLEIIQQGVPNYFGNQRFGYNANNLIQAEKLLKLEIKVHNRFMRGIYYSAARSWLFNQILSLRVHDKNWHQPIWGDVFQITGSQSIFQIEGIDQSLPIRILNREISPCSPLAGKSKNKVSNVAEKLILQVYDRYSKWLNGLIEQGLEESWRANILWPRQLHYLIDKNDVEIRFFLPAGAYATSVLRELVNF